MKKKDKALSLRDEFKKETGLNFVAEDEKGVSFFTDDYVEWFEEKIMKIPPLSKTKSSEKSGLKDKDITPYSEWSKRLRNL